MRRSHVSARDSGVFPSVSVIIPTRGRPLALRNAINSVVAQTVPAQEIIIVVDGPDEETSKAIAAMDLPGLRCLELAESSGDGGASARNAGVAVAQGSLVAFLDDDDVWLPGKLQIQLKVARGLSPAKPWVMGGGVVWRDAMGTSYWPTRTIGSEEKVADYLFVRNHPGEGWLPTSTLMAPRWLAQRVPFRVGLRQHVDYDWLLRLEENDAQVITVLDTVASMQDPPGRMSVSTAARWADSLRWAQESRHRLGEKAFSAFCLTEVGRRARAHGSAGAFLTVLRAGMSGTPRLLDLTRYVTTWLIPQRQVAFLRRYRRRSASRPQGTP